MLGLPCSFTRSFIARSALDKLKRHILRLHEENRSIQCKSSQMNDDLMFFRFQSFFVEVLSKPFAGGSTKYFLKIRPLARTPVGNSASTYLLRKCRTRHVSSRCDIKQLQFIKCSECVFLPSYLELIPSPDAVKPIIVLWRGSVALPRHEDFISAAFHFQSKNGMRLNDAARSPRPR